MSPVDKFDLKTHHFDNRGRLKGKNLYRLHVQDGAKYYERPVGSGNLWHEGGTPAGRVEVKLSDDGTRQTKIFQHTAEHIAYTPPLSGDEKLAAEHEELKARNAAMEAELAAIRNEQNQKESDSLQAKEEKPVPEQDETQVAKKASGAPIKNYKEML